MDEFKICEFSDGCEFFDNVEKFLEFEKRQGHAWRDQLDTFTAALEQRVSIDKEDPSITPIYEELNIIVKRIADGLQTEIPDGYNDLEVVPTGS